jgi:molecular chaperone Hsp33
VSRDVIQRFSFANVPGRGQGGRLAGTLEQAVRDRDYSQSAARLLGEMLAAVSLMADGIKLDGKVALQARGHGTVTTALAECRERHLLRGLVREHGMAETADHDATAKPGSEPRLSRLFGYGQMVITLTPDGPHATAYQGVVALHDDSLARNLEAYFVDSEQLPTRLCFAFEEPSEENPAGTVTGLLLQRLPVADLATELTLDLHANDWREIELLADTVTPEELSGLPLQTLLRRLFHQHTVTLHPARAVQFACTCSRQRAEQMLQALPREEILELLEARGVVDVTCEVCGTRYEYDQVDTHLLYQPGAPRVH